MGRLAGLYETFPVNYLALCVDHFISSIERKFGVWCLAESDAFLTLPNGA